MDLIKLIFSSDNLRMLVILAFCFCGFMWLNSSFEKRMNDLERSMLEKMDEKTESSNQTLYSQLKANDFAHLNNTIEALTFTLEKNGFLKREDKAYIDGRLDK